jgi:hypothetical protein
MPQTMYNNSRWHMPLMKEVKTMFRRERRPRGLGLMRRRSGFCLRAGALGCAASFGAGLGLGLSCRRGLGINITRNPDINQENPKTEKELLEQQRALLQQQLDVVDEQLDTYNEN